MTDNIKTTVDISSLFVAWASLIDWLPALAALLSIIWTGIRIYEWAKLKWN
tara:strand:- start:385 stop:537 length:153 start_codon:yes stop_codon:yes gene_type:complete